MKTKLADTVGKKEERKIVGFFIAMKYFDLFILQGILFNIKREFIVRFKKKVEFVANLGRYFLIYRVILWIEIERFYGYGKCSEYIPDMFQFFFIYLYLNILFFDVLI